MVIVESMFLGVVFDTFGRKIPLFFGILMSGVITMCIPLGRSLYPTFCVLRILISFSTVISLNVPLLPDYVQPESVGKASSYIEVVICFAYIFSSSGLMSFVNLIDEMYEGRIYFGLGILFCCVAVFTLYGVKDVVHEEEILASRRRSERIERGSGRSS